MSNKTNDLIKAVDYTALVSGLDPSDLNTSQEELKPETDRGFVVWTTDIAGVPTLPTITGDLVRLKRYIWARQMSNQVKLYNWNENRAVADPVYTNWEEIQANTTSAVIGPDRLSSNVAGFGLVFSTIKGLSTKLSLTNIAALRAIVATDLIDGTLIYIRGYYTDNDGGGGWFIKKTGTVVDDGGRYIVYAPSGVSTTSYWLRVSSADHKYRPEMFGAKGDGVTDDTQKILNCIDAFGRVDFMDKTYLVQSVNGGGEGSCFPLRNADDNIFTGEGIDRTILKLANNARGPSAVTNWFCMFQNYAVGESVNDAEFRDFTIDLNFNNQSGYNATLAGINIVGSHNTAERVKVINFGVGIRDYECFCILFTQPEDATDYRGSRILYCEATSPGVKAGSTTIAELSLFTISSYPGAVPDYTKIQEQPEIIGCKAWDIKRSASQTGMCHFVSISGAVGAKILNNSCYNVDGIGLYIQLYHNFDMLVEGNTFIDVLYGINFVAELESGTGNVHYDLWIKNALITNNIIRTLTTYDYAWLPHPPTGIYLYTGSQLNSNGTLYKPFENVVFANNFIYAKSFTYGAATSYPYGIKCQFAGASYLVTLKDNIFEVPDTWEDTTDHTCYNIPYEFAIRVQLLYTYSANSFPCYKNRSATGVPLKISILDNTLKNVTYLANSGYNFKTGEAIPAGFPVNFDEVHFDATSKRVYFPIKQATPVTTLTPGKTYVVITDGSDLSDHVDYDDGTGSHAYYGFIAFPNNSRFVATTGHTTFTATAGAAVYEDFAYHWKELGVEKDLPSTGIDPGAGISAVVLSENIADRQLEGLVKVTFDATAADKTIELPDPTYYSYRSFKLIVTRDSVANKVTLTCSASNKIVSAASEAAVNTLDIITNATGALKVRLDILCDGSHWYVNK